MRTATHHTAWTQRLGFVAVAAALLAGCVTPSSPQTGPIDTEQELRNKVAGGSLINEGGPVFALPGTVRMPAYWQGDLNTLTVRAERLDGGAFARVNPAAVNADGSFTLKGPITSQLFFATVEFSAKDATHRVRALARAQSGEPIIVDTASSLVTAKVALAAQARRLDDLNYLDTVEVTSQVRSVLATSLDAVSLDQPNEKLSTQLTASATKSEALSLSLRKWEAALMPASPTPAPTPSATPTPSSAPASSAEPIK